MNVLLLAAALLCAAPASAGMVEASLVCAREAAAPGETFTAALRLVHRPGWHTYWLNPGDSGLPTRLTWSLPPGWTAGALQWPAPERIETPPLTSFGYGGTVLFPVALTVAPDARPGTTARLRASARWLECSEICVPGEAELALSVPVAAAARPAPRAEAALGEALARLPKGAPDAVLAARRGEGRVTLVLAGRHPGAEFFPAEAGFEGARGPAELGARRTELTLTLSPGALPPARLSGILIRPGEPPAAVDLPVGSGPAVARALALAFLGGLLLNLMPCVFPVLSIKVLSLLRRSGGAPTSARAHAAAYAAGVVLSFLALAGALLGARAMGHALGWGFQLQSPAVVALLALLFVLIGLNLAGLFEVGGRWASIGSALALSEGYAGSFFSGVFAVVVAAPCTAPFMGAALGWAATRPAAEALPVFAALGLGTAAPYALLASWPALLARLPRPGPWMETLKKVLSVPMFATALWLLWILARLLLPASAPDASAGEPWSPEAVAEARAAGRTVFVDFTADWCLTCKVNERVVLGRPEVRAALARTAAFKADWTARDPRIADELRRNGRSGVPLYIVYPRGRDPVVLPEILSPRLVLDALGENGGEP